MSTPLTGEVLSVVFHNPDTNYTVLRVKSPDEPGQVTVVGTMGQLVPGESVALTGKWVEHPKFGRQYQAESCVQSLPATVNGIQRYLGSGLIKGMGPVLAKKMIDAFGQDVLDILDTNPQKLLQVEGIGPKKLDRIRQSWAEQREIRSLLIFLQTYEVPPTFAGRIFQRYGAGAVEKLRENPYDLAYEIRGIGFKTADAMALKLGFSEDSPQRLEALLVFLLFQCSEQGHVFFPMEDLFHRAAEVLGSDLRGGLEQALARLEERKRVAVLDLPEQDIEQAVFLRHFYKWEQEIASRLLSLSSHPGTLATGKIEQALQSMEDMSGLRLSPEQEEAVHQACLNKVSIVTGGPGTGKTTITRVVVNTLRSLGLKIKLAAPTGRASKRLSEATRCHASTIHRLLGFGPGGEFAYSEDKKLKADVLLVDEASMLDCQLFVSLLRALPLTCRLILVGDVNQLPSVGPGNVLSDLLESKTVPSMELTQIFRQARESTVVVNAHRINQGKFPVASPRQPPAADFFWVEQEDIQKVQDLILNTVCKRIPEVYGFDPLREVQVLTPMHKGLVGTSELNALLQDRLNPGGQEVRNGFRVFRVGDRVLQTRNNYEKDVFNGDLGWIVRMDQDSGEVMVDFDGHRVQYPQTDMDELQLAYCISVHKSQGSEYPAVLIPVVTQHFMLLQRNLIYTALTRATRLAVLIGSKKALTIGIKSIGGDKRHTHLKVRLQEVFGPEERG